MTVSTTNTKDTYVADGIEDTFAFSFPVLADSDITVQIVDTDGTLISRTQNTHYTVTGTGNLDGRTNYTSGSVVFLPSYIPADDEQVIIKREIPLLQVTDYVENDTFPAQAHEEALDRLTYITQQMQEQLNRSFKVDYTGEDTTDFSLPAPEPNHYLRFNSDGTALEAVANTGTIGLDNVEDDPSPSLGGHLDVNGKEIRSSSNGDVTIQPNGTGKINLLSDTLTVESEIAHYGDLDNKIVLGTDSQSFNTGGSSRIDINDSGLRIGGANARVTTIYNDDTLAANSGTALTTQRTVKAYTDNTALLADGPICRANLDMDGYSIVTNDSNEPITINPHGSGDVELIADTGGIIKLDADIVRVNANLTAKTDQDTGLVWNLANAIQVFTGGTARLTVSNSGLGLASGATVNAILDEDAMGSDSATALATQQSIKAYADGRYTAAVAMIPSVASQTQMENSTAGVYVSPAVARLHPSAAKFWVKFTPSGGVATINGSYGVTSVTYHSAGDYTVNLSFSFSSTSWAASVSYLLTSGTIPDIMVDTQSTSSVRINALSGISGVNPTAVYVSGFGDT